MTGQDAAKRAKALECLADIYHLSLDKMSPHYDAKEIDMLVAFVDAAVAEAVKERDEKLRLLGYDLTVLAQKNGALQDRLAQCQASWHSLSEGADVRVAEVRREERERCIDVIRELGSKWHDALPDDRPSLMEGLNLMSGAIRISAALRHPPASAPEGSND